MANTATSRTDPYAANVITHKMAPHKEGTHILVKYAKGGGTSATVTITIIQGNIAVEDEYKPIYLSGTLVIAQTFYFDTSDNYRIPLALGFGEKTVKASVSFTGGSDQTMVVDFSDD